MNRSKINVRYAKALFELAKETDLIKTLHRDIDEVNTLCKHSVDFMWFLHNPTIQTSGKKRIIREILHPYVHEMTLRFFLLVTENHRETEIPGICRNFIDLVRTEQGIVPVTVTTAEKLNREILTLIRQNLERETGKSVELSDKVNPSILGGMILRIEDQQFDGSFSTLLKKIKTAILAK